MSGGKKTEGQNGRKDLPIMNENTKKRKSKIELQSKGGFRKSSISGVESQDTLLLG